MKLSVIIVNYNVRYFLEQCLHSVFEAGHGIEMEVFVVDNNSVDGSGAMVKEKFKEVVYIENKENVGFSRANNQAIQQSTGQYILLLNPDTIIEEDTFSKVISFMDERPDAGGLGVKMVDGTGKFLPESKRGFPKPSAAFYKIFGLSALFPRSRVFGTYHLGYLDKEKIHSVEVLSGACMLIRKKIIDKIGGLDEEFFMYGEDIDLSYRIVKAGYKNYYFPETRIIHYKGESTKKSSLNYVFMFYNAMLIFARKHFSPKNKWLFSALIRLAIYFRASIAIIDRFLKRCYLPVLDASVIFGGIFFIKEYWQAHVIFKEGGHYPLAFITVAVPAYILIWLFSVYFSGGYDKPYKAVKIIQGLFVGTIIILTAYALLSETVRFSRALIILGSVWALISMLGLRAVLSLMGIKTFKFTTGENKRFVVVGEETEARRVAELLRSTHLKAGFIGLVNCSGSNGMGNTGFIGNITQLQDIITIYKIDETVFCSKNLSPQLIIDKMTELQFCNVEFKIAPAESLSIIGSKSINTPDDLFVLDMNGINRPNNRRSKLLFDVSFSLILLVGFPVLIFVVKNPLYFFRNIIQVLFRLKSWVGYNPGSVLNSQTLPSIRKGVLYPTDTIKVCPLSDDIIERLNILYANDYKVSTDISVVWKGFRELGRK